jgi:hypothetical protein
MIAFADRCRRERPEEIRGAFKKIGSPEESDPDLDHAIRCY